MTSTNSSLLLLTLGLAECAVHPGLYVEPIACKLQKSMRLEGGGLVLLYIVQGLFMHAQVLGTPTM